MKILIVSNYYPPYYVGGYELKCKLHADELMRRGHEVHVLTSDVGSNGNNSSELNVLRLLQMSWEYGSPYPKKYAAVSRAILKRYFQLKQAVAYRRNYELTYEVVSSKKPDIAYIWQLNGVSISPVLAIQKWNVPTVFRLDDYWLANLWRDLQLEPNHLKRRFRAAIIGSQQIAGIDFSHMLVVSQWVKKKYEEVGFQKNNIAVLPEGVPSSMILNQDIMKPIDKNRFKLIFVGRLVSQKGPHVAIEALAYLIDKAKDINVHLDIIGDGPNDYIAYLQRLVSERGLDNFVSFVGFMEHKDVLNRFTHYDAVLIPSLWEEPLSGTIAEAMAHGVPVIASDRGGNPEIVSNGENGLLVPPNDSVKLADAIKMLIENSDMAYKFKKNALATIRKTYIHEQIIDKIEEYFRDLSAASKIYDRASHERP